MLLYGLWRGWGLGRLTLQSFFLPLRLSVPGDYLLCLEFILEGAMFSEASSWASV